MTSRVALVTGGTKGIGFACARRLIADGFQVAICARNPTELDDVRSALASDAQDADVLAVPADLGDPDVGNTLIDAVVDRFGRIDALVNNAGIYDPVSFVDHTAETWDTTMHINLRGPVLLSGAMARQVERQGGGGRIVHISSTNGLAAEPTFSHYNASKAALVSLAMTMAIELAPSGILVNSVAPGWVRTPLAEEYIGSLTEEQLGDISPLRRAAAPEEIAGAVSFLFGPDATYVTGTTLVVDGGMIAMLAQPRDSAEGG